MAYWSQDQDELLRKLWTEGLSAALISARMPGTTRNSVIGRAYRLKLPPHVTARRIQNTVNVRRHRAKERAKREATQRQKVERSKVQRLLASVEPLPPPAATDIAKVSISDLENHHCKWVCAETRSIDALVYCGDQRMTGTPYCETHVRRAYKPVAPTRPFILSPPNETHGTWSSTVRIVPSLTPEDA